MVKKNNIAYEAQVPAFLRRMRGEMPDQGPTVDSKFHDKDNIVPDELQDDESEEPEYVYKGESITKAEFEEMKNGKSFDIIKADRIQLKKAEAEARENAEKKAEAVAKSKSNVSEVGTTRSKRRVVPVVVRIGESDEDTNSNGGNEKIVKRVKRGNKVAKKKKMQLSFDDDEQDG
ncbi:hypothetical protein V1514DRAFT_340183 [Lipomyces japonicus]|uniref:uncharacterized protein n=1 Tax=Lipomyces japonicus TaxID=56871 RepID=UPI0034D01AAB